MAKKTIWQILAIVVAIAVLLFGMLAIIDRTNTSNESAQESSQTNTTSVTIEGIYTDKSVVFSSPKTVLEILQQLYAQDQNVQLVTKEYSGLGILVQSIGDKTNGMDGKYWQYKVNGVMPQIGADKLEVKNGDTIEWYFDKSE